MPRVCRQLGGELISYLGKRSPLATQRRVDRRCRGRVEVAKPPRCALRIMSVKVGDQLIIREVPQAGAIISHAIGIAREVEGALLVAKHALVHRLEPQQVGRGPSARRRPFC